MIDVTPRIRFAPRPAPWIYKMRQDGGEERDPLGIRHLEQKPVAVKAVGRHGSGTGDSGQHALLAHQRAQAEIDQIGRAKPFHGEEEPVRCKNQGTEAGRRDRKVEHIRGQNAEARSNAFAGAPPQRA